MAAMAGMMVVLMGIMLLGVRRNYPRTFQGLLCWACAPLVAAAAAVVYALEGPLPPLAVILAGNLLLQTCFALQYFGSQRFYHEPVSWRMWLAVGLANQAALAYFFVAVPDYRMRVLVFTLTLAALSLAHARLLLRRGHGWTPRFTAGVLFCQATILLLRGFLSWWTDAPGSHRFDPSSLQTAYVTAYCLTIMLVSIGTQFMTSERMRDEFEYIATHDSLTGVLTRRAWQDAAHQCMRRADCQPVSMLMMDLDHFKQINDRHGHLGGDRVLVRFTELVAETLPDDASLGRYGGEEFVVLLPATDLPAAQAIAERVRLTVAHRLAPVPSLARSPARTVSIGVACAREHDSLDTLSARADAALYRAKAQGRNRVDAAA